MRFDNTDLASYFATRTSRPAAHGAVLNEAYLAEYGLETWQQSAFNFLGFMRLNRRSKFEPFGVSDERFHLIDGNDGIIHRARAEVARSNRDRCAATRLSRARVGPISLFFNDGSQPETADAVVLAVPFTVLGTSSSSRRWDCRADKRRAIATSATAPTPRR